MTTEQHNNTTCDFFTAVKLFDNITDGTCDYIKHCVDGFQKNLRWFLFVDKKYVLSPECWLAAITHSYYSCSSDADRHLCRMLLSKADVKVAAQSTTRERWKDFQFFVQSYNPDAAMCTTGITMREFLQSKHYTAHDVQLLRHVGLVVGNSVRIANNGFDAQLLRQVKEASHKLYSSSQSLWLQPGLVHCTEWQTFDNFDLDGDNFDRRICSADVCVRVLDGTLCNTMSRYRFEFCEISMCGSLNMLLLQLHAKPLYGRLCRRAQQLFPVLQQFFQCKFITDIIVGATLCLEHRYAAALLFDKSPVAFRLFFLRQNVPIFVPIMLPTKLMNADSVVRIFYQNTTTQLGPNDICVKFRTHCVTNNADENHHIVTLLHFERVCVFPTALPEKDYVQLRFAKHAKVYSACLVFSLPSNVSFDRFKFQLKDRFQAKVLWTAEELFISRCDNLNWYALSLKPLTNHRDAITYICEETPTIDPLCNVTNSTNVEMTFYSDHCTRLIDNLHMYLRYFNHFEKPNYNRFFHHVGRLGMRYVTSE